MGASVRAGGGAHRSASDVMTGAEFKAIRARLGCTGEAFARALGYGGSAQSLKTVTYRFELGHLDIPEAVARLATMIGAYGIPKMLSEHGPNTLARLTPKL